MGKGKSGGGDRDEGGWEVGGRVLQVNLNLFLMQRKG